LRAAAVVVVVGQTCLSTRLAALLVVVAVALVVLPLESLPLVERGPAEGLVAAVSATSLPVLAPAAVPPLAAPAAPAATGVPPAAAAQATQYLETEISLGLLLALDWDR